MPRFQGTITTPDGQIIQIEGVYVLTEGSVPSYDGAFNLNTTLPKGKHNLILASGRVVPITIVHTSGVTLVHHGFHADEAMDEG